MTIMKDTNRYRVQIINPQYSENFVKNPVPYSKLDGYTGAGASITLDDTHTRRGPQCIKATPSTGAVLVTYMPLSATSGKTYTFSVDVKGVAGQAMSIFISNNSTTPLTSKNFVATGNWQRIEVTRTMTTTSANYRVNVARPAMASTAPFWVDGFQFEENNEATTFFQGYERGLGYMDNAREYGWLGESRNSTSYRSAYTRHGGALVDISQYAEIKAIYGLGMGVFKQITTPVVTGGEIYQKHIRKARPFSIDLIYTGANIADLQKKRQALLSVLRPDATPYDQPLVLRIQVIDDKNDEAGDPVDIVCTFETSHTDTPNNPTSQKDRLIFGALDGHLLGAFKNGKTLDYKIDFQADYIIRRDPNGKWVNAAGNNPLAGVTGSLVQDIKEAPNGDIYVCGYFTGVSNGGTAVNYTKGIARWSKANQLWEAVGNPVTGATISFIHCMEFDAAGNLYVGGSFQNLAGIAAADYFAKYTVATNTWSAVGSGIEGNVLTIAISPDGTIYIGGAFTTASGNANNNRITYWNGSDWSPLATGLNNIVYSIKFHPNGDLLIGGSFINATGTKGDYICYWRNDTFCSFEDLGATPMSDRVMSIGIMPDGTIIVGGSFIAAGGDPNANLIAKWNGTNWAKFCDATLSISTSGGGAGAYISSVYCAPDGSVYAGGYRFDVNGTVPINRLVSYKNGYYQLPEFFTDRNLDSFFGILLASDGSLYLGGNFTGIVTAIDIKEIEYKLSTSSGSANAYPSITIVGPGKLEAVANHTTGRTIRFNNLTLLDGEDLLLYLEPTNLRIISTWEGRGSVWRYLNAGSDIGDWYIKPGTNSIGVFISSGYDVAKTKAYIHWQPKYWSLDGAVFE